MLEPIFDESSEGITHYIVASFTLDEVREASAAAKSVRVPVVQLAPYKESVKVLRLTNVGSIAETESGYSFVGCAKQLLVETKHTHEFEATVIMGFRTTWCTVEVTGEMGTMKTVTFESVTEMTGNFPQDLPVF